MTFESALTLTLTPEAAPAAGFGARAATGDATAGSVTGDREAVDREAAAGTITVPLTLDGAREALEAVLARLAERRGAEEAGLHRQALASACAGRGTLDWGGGLTVNAETDSGPSQLARAQHRQILSDTDLLEGLGRRIDAARVEVAGRLARASHRNLGRDGLARQSGFRNGPELLAALAGTSVQTAARRIRLAEHTIPESTLTGAQVPARFPAVHDAMMRGELGLDAARAITSALGAAIDRVGHLPAFGDAEDALVAAATNTDGGLRHPVEEVRVFVSRALAHLDPDGAAPSHAEQRANRGLRLTELSTGMTRVSGQLDPETAAIWHAVLTPTRRQLGREFDEAAAGADPVAAPVGTNDAGKGTGTGGVVFRSVPTDGSPSDNARGDTSADGTATGAPATDDSDDADTRTPAQRLLDRASAALKASLAVRDSDTGTSSLVHVHVRAEDLAAGRGIAWLDGVTDPIRASDAARQLCSGAFAATVFGEHGEVLAQGRTQRLFTKRQVLALRARDGGCRWPGCRTSPRDCEAHHIVPWSEGGATDLGNGVLLCQFHHSLVHERRHDPDSWHLITIDELPHLVPPAGLDRGRRPRPLTEPRWQPPGRRRQAGGPSG